MDKEILKKYLERIRYTGDLAPVRENLFALQEAHLMAVPYENWEILAGKEVSGLSEEALLDKIVTRKRGGYCFELNGALALLLSAFGFQVKEYFARWHFGEEAAVPRRRHRILHVVSENEEFLVDAGVGCDCPKTPLLFEMDTLQERNGSFYRVVKDPLLGFVVRKKVENEFVNFYSFTADPHFPQDFDYPHFWCSKAQESPFRQKFFLHKFTENGRCLIHRDEETGAYSFREFNEKGEMKEILLEDPAHLAATLEEVFSLSASFLP